MQKGHIVLTDYAGYCIIRTGGCTEVAVLRNPRHEKFSQLLVSGIKPTEAYVSLGYSNGGAPQSANKLLKRDDVQKRVHEILSLAAQSTAEGGGIDQKRGLSRLYRFGAT